MKKSVVIIPTYNEKENIIPLLRKIFSLPILLDVMIVDDNSPDGTATLIKHLQHEYPDQLLLEERTGKLGLGTAYIHGFKKALAKGYEYIFEMDADFSHNPRDLKRLYFACKNDDYDVSIGSRYIKGVNVVNWPMGRVLMSYCASIYVKYITGMSISDTTAGFVCYHRKVLETIDLDKISFIGYAFQIEMKFLAWKHGFRIKEIPIIFTDRTRGTSKMSKGIFREAIFGVIQIKIASLFKNYKAEAGEV